MDYTDKFFQALKPASEQQQRFIYWVMMTDAIKAQPRYGRLPSFGISAIHDVFYTALYTAMQAMRVCEMADVVDQATRKRLEEMALLANSSVDAAAAIGSALLTLEEEMIKAGQPQVHIQFDRTSGGSWIVNQTARGTTLLEATVAYCTMKINKIPKNKGSKDE